MEMESVGTNYCKVLDPKSIVLSRCSERHQATTSKRNKAAQISRISHYNVCITLIHAFFSLPQ
jgi:hypothetical protein